MNRFIISKVLKMIDKSGDEGLLIFGLSCNHHEAMMSLNKHLGINAVEVRGGMIPALWLSEKHMDVWSDKIGTKPELWDYSDGGFVKGDDGKRWGAILLDKLDDGSKKTTKV